MDLFGTSSLLKKQTPKNNDDDDGTTAKIVGDAVEAYVHPSQLYEVDDDGNYIHQNLIDSMMMTQQQQQKTTTTINTKKEQHRTMSLEDMLKNSNQIVEISQESIRGSYNAMLANNSAIQNTNDMGGSLGKVSGTARAKNQVTSLVHDAKQAELKLAQQQGMRHRTVAKSKYGW